MTSRPRRGLKSIRTMSQRSCDPCSAQRKYLTLAMLELRKSRCNKEKQSARERLENVDWRMAEIELQQAGLLARDAATLADTRERGLPTEQGFSLTY